MSEQDPNQVEEQIEDEESDVEAHQLPEIGANIEEGSPGERNMNIEGSL